MIVRLAHLDNPKRVEFSVVANELQSWRTCRHSLLIPVDIPKGHPVNVRTNDGIIIAEWLEERVSDRCKITLGLYDPLVGKFVNPPSGSPFESATEIYMDLKKRNILGQPHRPKARPSIEGEFTSPTSRVWVNWLRDGEDVEYTSIPYRIVEDVIDRTGRPLADDDFLKHASEHIEHVVDEWVFQDEKTINHLFDNVVLPD